jgi:FSR family fosmidomycin resistance protein-like MFS transporter
MLLFAALPVVIAAVIAREMPQLLRMRARAHLQEARAIGEAKAPDAWSPFVRLTGMAVFRSGVYYGLQSFIPAYFITRLGASPTLANLALTIMLASGVVGNLVGGRLADVMDRRVVVAGAMAVLPFLIWALLHATVPSGLVLLALVGFAAIGSSTVTVVLGQEYLPRQLGVASGITLGFSIGLGGLTASALGVVADRAGLVPVLWTIAALPIPAFILALTLPRVQTMRAAEATANPVSGD